MRTSATLRALLFLSASAVLAACSGSQPMYEAPASARMLAQDAIIVDGHIDVPYRLEEHPDDVSEATETGDFDYPRARAGGLDAPFMSIYIPARYQTTGGAKAYADSLIDLVESIVAAHPDKFALAVSPAEVRANHAAGLISFPMGMENGAPVESDLGNLKHFYDRGIRYITLTHSKDNEISDSSYDTTDDTHGGLSDFGREVVREMNRLGIMVDISHVSDAAFDDVMEVTAAPVIASHSSAQHFTPAFERNLDDARIERLAQGGGVLMINFGSSFLSETYRLADDAADEHMKTVAAERGWATTDADYIAYKAAYRSEHVGYADLSDVVDHIDYVVQLFGVDHVGLGSDFDGVGDSLPTGLKDVSMYPNLIDALSKRGYSEEDIRKILGENALRVWSEVEQIAADLSASAAATDSAAARVTELADTYMTAYFEQAPEVATFYGLPFARHDLTFDNSPEALEAWNAKVDAWHDALQAIDGDVLVGSPEWVTYGFLRDALEGDIATRVCRSELWSVSQMSGPHTFLPIVATRQPVGDDAARTAAITRYDHYGVIYDQEIENLREGLRLGYSAPRGNVERVIAQLDGLLALTGTDSPFYEPATRDSSETFRRQWLDLIEQSLYPSLAHYRDFLHDEYLPAARTTTATADLPDGKACYQARVRAATSLDLTPEEVHEIGLQRMEVIHAEMQEIAERSYDTDDVPALLDRLRTEEQFRYSTADEILAVNTAAVERARQAVPDYFGRLPKSEVVVEPVPDYEAPSAPIGRYFPPSEDGSTPGIYSINLYQPEARPRAMTEDLAFHEAIPGHHLQVALAQERPEAHPITRFLGSTAYSEGWGLYAERLAGEMGLYSSDLDRLGMLNGSAFRAARLVVDTGLHALGWTRQEAVDYMREHTLNDLADIETEVDRYIITPGQATAYMIGYNEIVALRAEAEAALGDAFDLKAFHDEVLADGSVTLPMLRDKIERWIAARQ